MRGMGYVRRGPDTRLDCDQPVRAVCRACSAVEYWTCDTYACAHCGERKRRRLMQVVDMGSADQLGRGRRGWFLTLTAPGRHDHKRWYQGRRPTTRTDCGCHLHGLTDGQWNAQESKCWNRLRTAWSREQDVTFIGSVETQRRGMLHRHIVVFTEGHVEHADLQRIALAAGYGCVLDLEPLQSVQKAARYVAKYVTKSSAERAEVPWVRESIDETTGEIVELQTKATFRTWSSSRDWSVTMKALKAIASAQARARAQHLKVLAEVLGTDQAVGSPAASISEPARGPD